MDSTESVRADVGASWAQADQAPLSGSSWTTVLFLSLLFGACIILAKRFKAHRRQRHREAAPQHAHPKIVPRTPGDGAPVLHGVRVVELSTYAAAPSAARCMGDLGAEVLKIEDPNGANALSLAGSRLRLSSPPGDPFRYTLLEYEKDRDFGSMFEVCNLSKRSVQLDLNQAIECAAMI